MKIAAIYFFLCVGALYSGEPYAYWEGRFFDGPDYISRAALFLEEHPDVYVPDIREGFKALLCDRFRLLEGLFDEKKFHVSNYHSIEGHIYLVSNWSDSYDGSFMLVPDKHKDKVVPLLRAYEEWIGKELDRLFNGLNFEVVEKKLEKNEHISLEELILVKKDEPESKIISYLKARFKGGPAQQVYDLINKKKYVEEIWLVRGTYHQLSGNPIDWPKWLMCSIQ